MSMSYSRLLQLKHQFKYFQRLCTTSNIKSTNSSNTYTLPTSAEKNVRSAVILKKEEKCLTTDEKEEKSVTFEERQKQITYELPQVPVKTDRATAMELFHTDYNLAINVISALNSVQFTPYGLKKAWNEIQELKLLRSQEYIKERAEFLGPELATAHFVCYRGGKVRFHGEEQWIAKDPDSDLMENLPNIYVDFYKMEAVDCSKMTIIYEGLENMKCMENLKWLSFEGCAHFDDWCLDRIVGEYSHTLEYLNIQNCPLVTERGIATLSKMKRLQTLVLGNHPNARNLELVCLMLEDVLPNLTIRGIIYCDESLLTKS